MIAVLEGADILAGVNDHARTFVPKDRGKQALRIVTGQRESIRVAYPGRLDLHQHFARFRAVKVDRLDTQRRSRSGRDRGPDFHGYPPSIFFAV